ncbi:MAG: SLBB domain-containing protein [Candidatus Eisenbacteria bacterium]|nr:SLBB domain-containing protein [Candidatus Eisenbacteria bacterium]
MAFNSRRVFLAGQVQSPGRYAFEQMPDIVNLLGQAGGLGAGGDLSQVRILRQGDAGEQTLNVDLNKAIKSGDLGGLPALQPGDVVFVPPTAGAVGGGGVGSDAVYVLGDVARPGGYSASAGIDLAQALGLAGGTTPNADLTCIEVLARDGVAGSYLVKVNLDEQLRNGSGGPEIRAGDTIRVPSRTTSKSYQAWNILRAGLGTTRDVLNLILIRDALDNNN